VALRSLQADHHLPEDEQHILESIIAQVEHGPGRTGPG
jgi:hypothetical protein